MKWSSNKPSVVSVGGGGSNTSAVLTALKPGTAKVTAKVGNKKCVCTVTVPKPKLSAANLTITEGSYGKLKIENANMFSSRNAKCSSSDESVAKVLNVSGRGMTIEALSAGTTTITIQISKLGDVKVNIKLTCKVTVK